MCMKLLYPYPIFTHCISYVCKTEVKQSDRFVCHFSLCVTSLVCKLVVGQLLAFVLRVSGDYA